jgi:predicted DNA repair protein MutK
LHHFAETALSGVMRVTGVMGNTLFDGLVGVLAGLIVVGVVTVVRKWRGTAAPSSASG